MLLLQLYFIIFINNLNVYIYSVGNSIPSYEYNLKKSFF